MHVWETVSNQQTGTTKSDLGRLINDFERKKICELLGEQACEDI